ncbi:MAG: transporter substrate-binding domain-containing protein [Desulfobacterales bacterium]|nr:transporter substrate-binding domain-containing protein [Desulfobacterales bacterium]
MRNRLMWVFSIIMTMTVILSACSNEARKKIEKVSDLKGKVVGMSSFGEEDTSIKKEITNSIGGEPKELLLLDTIYDGIASLMADKIDALVVFDVTADYYIKRNNNLKFVPIAQDEKLNILMTLRSEDQKLKEDLNKAINTLKETGILKKLEDKWITNLSTVNETSNQELPKNKDLRTFYVGISGDLLPLEYIAADGKPAGYDVALFAEIGKLLKINFEFISVEKKARFMALSSKKIDVIMTNDAPEESSNSSFNARWISTKPYYQSKTWGYMVKK